MIKRIHLRGAAVWLLQGALKIAPPYASEWGRAMLGELHYVQNDWDAFIWATSGAGVLTKHALFSLMIPGYAREMATSESKFFAKENSMRKSTLIAAAACLAATLLFFVLPTFRQAFRISAKQGGALISSLNGSNSYLDAHPYFVKVSKEAWNRHDAEGLAFAAIHRSREADSHAMAEEAVRLDPKLTWIYVYVVNRFMSVTGPPLEVEWVSKLEQFDPQNALPHLITAQRAAAGKYDRKGASNPEWQNAMAAAFACSRLDTYSDRLKELDHKVALRYSLSNPHDAAELSAYLLDFVLPVTGNPKGYARILVNDGDTLAAKGDSKGAAKQYLLAAHFGEMMQPPQKRHVEDFVRGWSANTMLQEPYQHLSRLYEKQGDKEQAGLFDVLASKAERAAQGDHDSARHLVISESVAPWNTYAFNFAGLSMFICVGVILSCVIMTIARGGSIQFSKLRLGRTVAAFGGTGVAGLLLSSVTLYFGYKPYADALRLYLRDGDTDRLRALNNLFGYLTYLPDYRVHFWTGIIALGLVALVCMTIRLITRSRQVVAVV